MRSSPSARRERRRSRPLLLERLEGRLCLSVRAYWRFEEGLPGTEAREINTILDSSGNELHGTPLGGPVYRAQVAENPIPQTGSANALSMDFNGGNQFVMFPDDRLFRLTQNFTVEAYINPRSFRPQQQIVFRGDDRPGLDPYYLTLFGSNLTFGITNELNQGASVATLLPALNQWYHVAGTLNGSTGEMKLYLNGSLVSAGVTQIRPLGLLDPTRNPGVGIGNTQWVVHGQYFDGFIDEVRISDTALTRDQLLNARRQLFHPSVPYGVGSQPRAVAVGDFNRDGALDLVTAHESGGVLNVLLGNGDGTFRSAIIIGTTRGHADVVVADYNEDDIPDLAVANWHSSSTVSILLGIGDGTFRPPLDSPTGSVPAASDVADFDNDGHLDLVVVNRDSSNARLLWGNGDGTFRPGESYGIGVYPHAVRVGDLNRDGVPDFVTASTDSHALNVFLGNGDGTFRNESNPPVGLRPFTLALADLNGDGALDIAAPNYASDTVSVLLGNGDGTFQLGVPYAVGRGPLWVVAADFDGDGTPDLAVTSQFDNHCAVLLGNGDGTFGMPLTFAVGSGPVSLAVADFNGDAAPDLAVAGYSSASVSVLLNTRLNFVAAFYVYPSSGTVPAGAPFDVYVSSLNDVFEVIPTYTGEILFWSTDPRATLPDVYRFQRTDGGIAYFPEGLTFNTPGVQELYVFDTATYTVFGYAAFDVVGGGPSPGGDAGGVHAPAAPDLFAGQELARVAGDPFHRLPASVAVPAAGLRPAADSIPSDRRVSPVPTAGASPAARLDRAGAVRQALLDQLFAKLEEHWLAV